MNLFQTISPEPDYIASLISRHIELPGIVKMEHVRTDETETPTVEEILHITFHQAIPTAIAAEYPERVKGLTQAHYAFFGSIDGLPYTIRDGDRVFDVSYDSDFLSSLPLVEDDDDALDDYLNLLAERDSICVLAAASILRECFDDDADGPFDLESMLRQFRLCFWCLLATAPALPRPLREALDDAAKWIQEKYPVDAESWRVWLPFYNQKELPKQTRWAELKTAWVEQLSDDYQKHMSKMIRQARERFFRSFSRLCRENPDLLSEYRGTLEECLNVYLKKPNDTGTELD